MTIKSTSTKRAIAPGMTLLEVTVIVVVLLTFLGMTFIGVRAWKRGSDRMSCVMNIYRTQMAVRSVADMNGLAPGTDAGALSNPIDVQALLMGENGFIDSVPECPGSGTYHFGGNVIPRKGVLYVSCSMAAAGNHVPIDYAKW